MVFGIGKGKAYLCVSPDTHTTIYYLPLSETWTFLDMPQKMFGSCFDEGSFTGLSETRQPALPSPQAFAFPPNWR